MAPADMAADGPGAPAKSRWGDADFVGRGQRTLAALDMLAPVGRDAGDGPADASHRCRTVAELVGARRAVFLRLDGDGVALSPAAAWGIGAGALERLSGPPRAAAALAAAIGARDAMSAWSRAGARRLGMVVVFDSAGGRGFSDEDAWILDVATRATGLAWQQSDAKTNFLNLASHELRGPIGVVRGYLSMIRDGDFGEVDERMRPPLEMVSAKVDQIWRLVEQMVEATRRDERGLALRRERVDLGATLTTAADEMRPLAEAAHRLEVRTPPDPVLVDGDPMRLVDVVASLIDNAIKYSPDGGGVWCELEVRGDHAVISVRDQGLGIAPEDQPHIFTRFGRIVTPENSHIPGSGLGLSHAYEVVSLHRGELTVTSTPGAGSTFSVVLPLAPP